MFKTPKMNCIESTDGYSVEITSITRLKYIEGERSVVIGLEPLANEPSMVVYLSEIKKWNDGTLIDKSTRSHIKDKIQAALQHNGINACIEL